ncbi:MAG TPA: hypothetical protein DCE44_13545, partial [Verrucomicrobiales bacterium]|nr:hypothetical protein [Verrucomicrobiales bacterium]
RAWLFGIVRNLAANASRRERRRGEPDESLDMATEHAGSEADPAEQAVSREEATLLWRLLAGLPETYREPLVLFYRQSQSVTEVADALDLSEEAVKQRLSRGRAMLREELAAVVESTLIRTRPGPSFTAGVLVALPMLSGSATSGALTVGTVAGSTAGTAGKSLLAKLGLGVFVGPVIGLACTYFGTKAAVSTARSKEERTCILCYSLGITAFCLVMSFGLVAVLSQAGKLYTASAASLVLGVLVWTAALVGGVMFMCRRMERDVKRIRLATSTAEEVSESLGCHR